MTTFKHLVPGKSHDKRQQESEANKQRDTLERFIAINYVAFS